MVLTGLQKPTCSFSLIVLIAILAFNFIYSDSQKEYSVFSTLKII